jgi:hypothetical protein
MKRAKFYSNIKTPREAAEVEELLKNHHLIVSIDIQTEHPKKKVVLEVEDEQSIGTVIRFLSKKGYFLSGKKPKRKQSFWARLFSWNTQKRKRR